MKTFTTLTSRVVPLLVDNIDTDQVIPARFLKTTDERGLGDALFSDWRYAPDGSPKPDFPLNRPHAKGAAILLAGANFGCGSSREHAPWALVGFGFRAVVARGFADIFRGNALKNGLLPVEVDDATHARYAAAVAANPAVELAIDLDSQTVRLASEPVSAGVQFPIDPFARRCLLAGQDELAYLLSFDARIRDHEARHAQ